MIGVFFSIWVINLFLPSFELVRLFVCDGLLYIVYFLLGYFISTIEYRIGKKWIGALGLLLIYLLGVLVFLYEKGTIVQSIMYLIEAVALFGVLLRCEFNSLKNKGLVIARRVVCLISELSYGIYLTHCAFISVLVSIPLILNSSIVIEPLIVAIGTTVIDVLFLFVLKKLSLKKWVM